MQIRISPIQLGSGSDPFNGAKLMLGQVVDLVLGVITCTKWVLFLLRSLERTAQSCSVLNSFKY